MTYTALFWTACTLIGAFAAAAFAFWRSDSLFWVGAAFGTAAVFAMLPAMWAWEKRRDAA